MSTIGSHTDPLSEDDRFLMARTAATSERKNAPWYLLVVSMVVLIACAGALFLSVGQRASAQRSLEFQTRGHERDAVLVARLEQLRTHVGENQPGPGAEATGSVRSRIVDAAVRAGVAAELGIPTSQPPRIEGGMTRHGYKSSRVIDKLEPLLEWLRLAPQEISGLEVSSITLRPQPQTDRWSMDVVFTRWESK